MTFSIIIPTRNERNNLKNLLPVLVKLYSESPIWIVDDDSTDQTAEFVKSFSQKYPKVHLISRKNKLGRGSALLDGLKEAYKDNKISYFLEMDADFSHNPQEIKKLLPQVRSNTIVIGSRHVQSSKFINCSPIRVILSHLANWYARLILGIPIRDYTNGFRLYPRNAVEILSHSIIHEKGYVVLSETAFLLHKRGFNFKEVPTVFVNRVIGHSNATIFEFLRSLPAILKIRFFYTF